MAELHSTKSAARYLGVSEASVRRWSDTGRLPVQRVGRRRTRRYAAEDLERFKTAERPDPVEIGMRPSLPAIHMHGHLVAFYDTDAGRLRMSVPFLREGLLAGQPCVLVVSDEHAGAYRDALAADGTLDPDKALDSGALVIRSGVGLGAREAIVAWEALWWRILGAGGVSAIRVVGEMGDYEAFSGTKEMLEYEVAYDSVSKRFPLMTLCQYDVREFDGSAIMGAMLAHPDLFTRRISDFLV